VKPSAALSANKSRVMEIISRFDVSNPRIFGSVARGEDDEASDIDILVDPGEGITFYDLARLERELQTVLGCKVDVTTPKGLSSKVTENVAPDLKPLS
jgi:uncharacterized protein